MTEKRIRPEEEKVAEADESMDDVFDDDDEMEMKNAEPQKDQNSADAKALQNKSYFSPQMLAQYYSRLFPFEILHEWLSYDPSCKQKSGKSVGTKVFSRREFSFTIEPTKGEEIYIRYQSFLDKAELTNAVLKRNPHKIDIGAVFSHPPKDHHTIQGSSQRKFAPVQRELVFDVDLTDYDCVRNCGCTQAKICNKCWKMMHMAMKVMDAGLKEDFGFKNIAWFYSGRRGVHAWVCDENARELSDGGRSAVASYFEVNLGTDKNQNVELTNPLHPTLQRAYAILEPMFVDDIIHEGAHCILSSEKNWTNLLETLPPAASAVKESLERKWKTDNTTPQEKWAELKRYLDVLIGKVNATKKTKQSKKMGAVDRSKIELWPVATVFRYTYPRLDINVSKMQNHLLKSPFCVHPKTGRVCVPIDIKKVEEFDPFDVPTLPQLMEELDSYEGKDGHKIKFEWEKTSLSESFSNFQTDFLTPLWKDLRSSQKVKAEQQAAITADF